MIIIYFLKESFLEITAKATVNNEINSLLITILFSIPVLGATYAGTGLLIENLVVTSFPSLNLTVNVCSPTGRVSK